MRDRERKQATNPFLDLDLAVCDYLWSKCEIREPEKKKKKKEEKKKKKERGKEKEN